MRLGIIAAACIVSLTIGAFPASAAEDAGLSNPYTPTPTSLYFHINGFQDFPVNTQKPDASYTASEGQGTATVTTSCFPEVPGAPLTSKNWHTFYGFSSPGYVEYYDLDDGRPRFHAERGISFDVHIDSNQEPTLYWYLETQAGSSGAGGQDPNSAPLVVPQVMVRATMREGDSIGIGDEHYNEGNIIMIGTSDPYDLSPQSENYRPVGGKQVYEFAIPMDIQQDKIPRATGYNIRVDVYMKVPGCEDPDNGSFMANNVKVHTSPDARPRVDLSIMNPVRIEFLHPQFILDDMVIHTAMNSPWGNYDVAEPDGIYGIAGGIELDVSGPSEPVSLDRVAFVQRHHEHNHHQEAVDVTWVWPYRNDGATNGVYTVKLEVQNDQQTAVAIGTASFEIGKGTVVGCGGATTAAQATDKCEVQIQQGGKVVQESPGLGILLVGVFALIAMLRRR